MSDGRWAPYVPVAQRRARAEREIDRLRRQGDPAAPVVIEGRTIARTFWGKAWCDTLEGYRDYDNRLPRGRTYVRNGSVIDLRILAGTITATVSGSSLYQVRITVKPLPASRWQIICRECGGSIGSRVELLQGRLSLGVMARLCSPQHGLFPRQTEISLSCSCPDGAVMCKHVAAVLYGVGARLDQQPELLFRLRGVDETELITAASRAMPIVTAVPAAGKLLEGEDLAALFGLDLAAPAEPPSSAAPSPDAAEPARAAGPAGRRRKAAKPETAAPARYDLTPDGFVKWWK
ncbi:SWIM zinc finger family protein [Phaeospirillum tilakii]|uniref:SWIM zinc finger family protein n=1 Tax=Phaeospirillum tilakii TaxID=741673 RepID=A0ABW5CFY6_9PROT